VLKDLSPQALLDAAIVSAYEGHPYSEPYRELRDLLETPFTGHQNPLPTAPIKRRSGANGVLTEMRSRGE